MDNKAILTPALLRQLLDYNPETGKLVWKPRPAQFCADNRIASIFRTRCEGKEALNCDNGRGYLCGTILGNRVKAHKIIWAMYYGEWPDGVIDHINHIKHDNRIENLRVVSSQENSRNRPSNPTSVSGKLGVHWHKPMGKWLASINKRHLGVFDDLQEAIAVRIEAERALGFHENHG